MPTGSIVHSMVITNDIPHTFHRRRLVRGSSGVGSRTGPAFTLPSTTQNGNFRGSYCASKPTRILRRADLDDSSRNVGPYLPHRVPRAGQARAQQVLGRRGTGESSGLRHRQLVSPTASIEQRRPPDPTTRPFILTLRATSSSLETSVWTTRS